MINDKAELVPCLVADISSSRPSQSFFVKAGNRALAAGLSWQSGVMPSSSTAKRATEHYGGWHLELLIGAAYAHAGEKLQKLLAAAALDESVAASIREARCAIVRGIIDEGHGQLDHAYQEISRCSSRDILEYALLKRVHHTLQSFCVDGGVKGIPSLAAGFPLMLWHAKQDGPTGETAAADGKRAAKKRKTAAGSTAPASAAILAALATLDVKLEKSTSKALSLQSKEAAATHRAVEATASAGTLCGLPFFGGTLELPSECFFLILRAAGAKPILTSLQKVAKGWLAAARDPALYTTLDYLPLAVTMAPLIALLSQPKFRLVESLTLHHKHKLGKSGAEKLGKAAPHLAHINARRDNKLHFTDDDVISLAVNIPSLTSLTVDMWSFSQRGVTSFAFNMGARLRHLNVEVDTITNHYMSNWALYALAQHCPELRSLEIHTTSYHIYTPAYDRLDKCGVLALLGIVPVRRGVVDGCFKLEKLILHKTMQVDIIAFESIADRLDWDRLAHDPDRPPNLPRLALTTLRVRDVPALSSRYSSMNTDVLRAAGVKERLAGLLPRFSYEEAHTPRGAHHARLHEEAQAAQAAQAELDEAAHEMEDEEMAWMMMGEGVDDDEGVPAWMLDDE